MDRKKLAIAIFFSGLMVTMGLVAITQAGSIDQSQASGVSPSVSGSIPIGGSAIIPVAGGSELVDSFNPFNPSLYPTGIQDFFYEPLFQINPLNGTTLPWLATNYTWASNYLTLNVSLRHGVQFSNGESFNAADVVFTFNMLKKYPETDLYDVWQYLSNVSSNGQYNVTFHFNTIYTPAFYYIGGLVFIVPKDIWQNLSNPATYTDSNPIGTGPFVMGTFSPTKIVLDRNNNYWQPNEPHLSHIEYLYYSTDSAGEVAMEKGEVNWDGVSLSNAQTDYVDHDPSHFGYYFPKSSPLTVFLNNLRWPLNESFMRVAMSEAINRTYIYETSEYGYMPPSNAVDMTPSQASEWLNSTVAALADKETTFNVTAAISLLNAHGYTIHSNGRLYAPNGTEIPSMTIYAPEGWTNWDGDIATVASEMSSIGLKVTAVTPTVSSDFNYFETGNFWMAYEVSPIEGPEPYYTFEGEYFDGGSNVTSVGKTASTDYERWNSTEYGFNSMLSNLSATSNKTLEKKLVNEISSLIANQMPTIPTVYNIMYYEWNNETITGFPTPTNNYWPGDPTLEPQNEVIALHLYEVSKKPTTPVTISPDIEYGIIGAAVVIIAASVSAVAIRRKRTRER